MKAVIFAGGIGTRMWPASRAKTPKQFRPTIGNKSTLELMYYDYVGNFIPQNNIYIATNQEYQSLVKKKIKHLQKDHLFLEPAMRDLGPAVGYSMAVLNQQDPLEPVAIVWSDDLIKKPKIFHQILATAEQYLSQSPNQLVYIGVNPLFPDQNKGWIHFGKVIKHFNGLTMYTFKDWHYRPPLQLTQKFFASNHHAINTGYFVSTPQFIINLYQKYAPQMYQKINQIVKSWGTNKHSKILNKIYPQLEKISFDDLIINKTATNQAIVIIGDLGWYGFGDWESMKEALQNSPNDIITQGRVYDRNSKDSLIYNYSPNQLVTTINLKRLLVVVTEDVIMVCPKESVPEIKKLLQDFQETEYEKYT